MKEIPKKGDTIYVPTSLYVYRGNDDFVGGKATISGVHLNEHLRKDHHNYIMVSIEGRPNTRYNYRSLMESQDELKERYGDQVAHPSPDDRDAFNCGPNEDWLPVDAMD